MLDGQPQELSLEPGQRRGEVRYRDEGRGVRWDCRRGGPGNQVQGEVIIVVHRLVPHLHGPPRALARQVSAEDGVEDWFHLVHLLHDEGLAETYGQFELRREAGVPQRHHLDCLLVPRADVVLEPFRCVGRGVDNQGCADA